MLTLILNCKTILDAQQTLTTIDPIITAIELRVDYLENHTLETINSLCQQATVPVILTLRNQQDGGRFDSSEIERHQLLIKLSEAKAEYIDIEDHVPTRVLDRVLRNEIKVIRSHHDFQATTEDLNELWQSLQHPGVSQYKIATKANSSLDSLRMLLFSKKHHNLTAHCMGEDGLLSRYLATLVNTPFIFSQSSVNPVMEYIPTIKDFKEFQLQSINQKTKLYALIGDPVRHSPGMQFHNRYFKEQNINARYIHIRLQKDELNTFLSQANELGIYGLSVTIPLKQALTEYVSTDLKAINTVRLMPAIQCCNTDGIGTINALLEKTTLQNKSILILGAGGTANGIADALSRASFSCQLCFLNRTASKAKQLARRHGGTTMTDDISHLNFDVIINTLPPQAYNDSSLLEKIARWIDPQTTVMDVNYHPKHTPLLKLANTKQATTVFGERLFYHQAIEQQNFWRRT